MKHNFSWDIALGVFFCLLGISAVSLWVKVFANCLSVNSFMLLSCPHPWEVLQRDVTASIYDVFLMMAQNFN